MKPLIDTQEFLSLSSFLNYQLAGEPTNWQGILNLLVGSPWTLDETSTDFLLETLEYLGDAYGTQKRRLGPLAILHPIRTSALLAKAHDTVPNSLDLLTALFHDKEEDLTIDRYSQETWERIESKYQRLLQKIDSETNWFLNERIAYLAKAKGQKYTEYLGQLLGQAKITPQLATIKLADRLDNTLDLRIDLQDFADRPRTFQVIFDILFANSYNGLHAGQPHPTASKINGARRLFQLYKNAVFLSMLHSEKIHLGKVAQRLFYSLAVASIREAQTILLHIFAYHITVPSEQRAMLVETMHYSHEGGYDNIRDKGPSVLDGFFRNFFIYDSAKMKKERLDALYQDKRLMGLAAISFLTIFANFINSEEYVIRGISAAGIIPEPWP